MRRFTFLVLILSLLVGAYATAEVYKTIDKNGRITFSDVPPPNVDAKPIELKSINTTPPPTTLPQEIPPNPNIDAQSYELHLLAPKNGTTLMANERSVTISVSLNRLLQNGDLLAYKLDGNILTRTTESSFTFNEPPRGEHSLTVDVINTKDKSLAQSDAITIVVMRPLPKQTATPVPKK